MTTASTCNASRTSPAHSPEPASSHALSPQETSPTWDLRPYFDDLEQRMDNDAEEGLLTSWRGFLAGASSAATSSDID